MGGGLRPRVSLIPSVESRPILGFILQVQVRFLIDEADDLFHRRPLVSACFDEKVESRRIRLPCSTNVPASGARSRWYGVFTSYAYGAAVNARRAAIKDAAASVSCVYWPNRCSSPGWKIPGPRSCCSSVR